MPYDVDQGHHISVGRIFMQLHLSQLQTAWTPVFQSGQPLTQVGEWISEDISERNQIEFSKEFIEK